MVPVFNFAYAFAVFVVNVIRFNRAFRAVAVTYNVACFRKNLI